MKSLDIFIVTYRPHAAQLQALLESLAGQKMADCVFHLHVWDNSGEPQVLARIKQTLAARADAFATAVADSDGTNLGYGMGHNRLLARSAAPWVLILNQDTVLEPGSLAKIFSHAEHDPAAAAWEFRQIPYEHPKAYDPVTLETPWVSGAAALFRRAALEQVAGFEPRIFMYGEDVDLSWRLRCKGWRLRYVPQAAVVHHTYAYPEQIKALQVLGGTLSNLCLRARFGTWRDIAAGVALLIGEMMVPQAFAGRRRGLVRNLVRYPALLPYFRKGGWHRNTAFRPVFSGWDYELRRHGAFHPFEARSASEGEPPLVSVLVRTHKRPHWLREALLSVKHQTYPNVEVVVVEDGAPCAAQMVRDEFAPAMNVRYFSTGERVGRARAGNLALQQAAGEWLCFLDDDDVLFADHVEVLLKAALEHQVRGAYGLSWETATQVISEDPLEYRELMHEVKFWQPFSRIVLWHHNFLPIQSVLFHRSLFEKYGGFEEDMDQLEDWNLWTRYTLDHDFVLVEKTTSKYRVPHDAARAAARQAALDAAYADAVRRQAAMRFESDPRYISQMVEDYLRTQAVIMVSRRDLRSFVERFAVTRWLARRRGLVAGIARRIRRRRPASGEKP
ncbi:MAG: glycosyltransferase family 2 protein [Burkholderiales bacterium]